MTTSPGAAATSKQAVIAELRTLRKGRGLRSGDLEDKLGPNLSKLVARVSAKDPSQLRQLLTADLQRYANDLPQDLRMAIQASLGLSAETRDMPLFRDRVSWLAGQLGYEYRTALRRIEAAEQIFSEQITRELLDREQHANTTTTGWHLEELITLVRLDTPTPEIHERRRITATEAGLKEVLAWTDVPPTRPSGERQGLAAEVLYGGRLARRLQPGTGRFQFVVQLPEQLQPGQVHEYGMLFRIPPDQPMRPHYVFSPECQCGSFELRVRFDPARLPASIRRVDGETIRMLDSPDPNSERMVLDEAAEIHLKFQDPAMYLCYGLQWQPVA